MSTQAETIVARGAALLDNERLGWYDHINLDTLNLHDPYTCILGQEYAEDYNPGEVGHYSPYHAGLMDLFGTDSTAVFQYGFDHEDQFDDDGYVVEADDSFIMHDLQDAWVTEILRRRDGDLSDASS